MSADRTPIIDMDTHVGPSLELLKEHASESLLQRWDELAPYIETKQDETGVDRSTLRVNPIPYTRTMNASGVGDTPTGPGGAGALYNKTVKRGNGEFNPGVQHDNAKGRLVDMDIEGVDIHVLIPGTWGLAATAIEPDLAVGLYDAYTRYAASYCSENTDRIKGLLLAPAVRPEWAAAKIREHGAEPWVSSVALMLPEGLPVDDPSLTPIWEAMNEMDLGLMFHSFFYEAPYFPGYRDMWGNLAAARTAAHPWGAQRVLAYLTMSGLFDRYPNLRIAFSETGAGWLPSWLRRLNFMTEYLPSAVPTTAMKPMEYAQAGHVFAGIQLHEGPDIAKAIVDIVGDGVMMYQSDYPHGECEFPDSVKHAQTWSSHLDEPTMEKFLGGNAARFLRLD